jgi:hypothetical protein
MAIRTNFLNLILPANNEFFNTWDKVVNENFQKVENKIQDLDDEIIASRGSQPNLQTFLAVGHEQDGNLKPTVEVGESRASRVYGYKDVDGFFQLDQRLNFSDFETFFARASRSNLRDRLALRGEKIIIEGSKSGLGLPTWLGFTDDKAIIDGSVTALEMLVSGHYQRVRTLEEVVISGAAGTYVLYADYNPAGTIIVDGDSSAPPPANPTGATGVDINNERIVFADSATNFTTFDVRAGDLLRILGNVSVKGDYPIAEVAYDGNPNWLRIIGLFRQSLSALNYVTIDPFKPTIGFVPLAAATPQTNRLYIGEVDFDGGSVTAVRPRHFRDYFVGEWRAIDVSGGNPNFEEIWNHRLGSTALKVTIQASLSNDGSTPVEELSLSEYTESELNFANTLSFNPGTTDATLTGSVTSTLDPGAKKRSVKARHTRNQIFVKNAVPSVFFSDYDGSPQQIGFIRVILERKGE